MPQQITFLSNNSRTNDEGWSEVFIDWLKISKLGSKDIIFIFSVGGGNIKNNISVNLIKAIKLAKKEDQLCLL